MTLIFQRVLLFYIGVTSLIGSCSSAKSIDASPEFTSLKAFLNTNYPEYEITFSVLHQSNNILQKQFESLFRGSRMTMIVDRPVFYKARITRDGYSLVTAYTLDDIQGKGVAMTNMSAFGLTSNNLCWSANNNNVVYDAAEFAEMTGKYGPGWVHLKYQQASKLLSLCLPVRKGTVIWNGTNFTAERDIHNTFDSKDSEQGVRISGSLTFSNGMPSVISCTNFGLRHTVTLSYDGALQNGFILPKQLLVDEELPNKEGDNIFTWTIINLTVTNFPPNSTAPSIVLNTIENRSVVTLSSGVETITTVRGKQLPTPMVANVARTALNSKHILWVRAVIFATLLFPPIVAVVIVIKKRCSRPK